jgi:hypothetical protein
MNNREELYNKLATIGFRVNTTKKLKKIIDIEELLVVAIYEVDNDSRMIGLVFSWLKIHHKHIFADKFFRSYDNAKKYLGHSPWFHAVCAYLMHLKDNRFKKGLIKQKTPKYVGDRDQNIAIKRKGAIEYLQKVNILIPNGNLRIRDEDVLTVDELVSKNMQYRNRLIFGANWRSEIITAIMNGAKNANQVAKKLGINRTRVGIVFKEYQTISNHLEKGLRMSV